MDDESNEHRCTTSVSPLHQKGLLGEDHNQNQNQDDDSHKKSTFFKLGKQGSPCVKFQRLAPEKDVNAPSCNHTFRGSVHRVFNKKINWKSLQTMAKEWISNPINMVLFIWIICVAISGAILFLVMTGMLNHALPKKSQRNTWFEVNNQILNALFTLMCLYQHPHRLYHLILLSKWRPQDISKLRNSYSKNGTYKPNEWAHMMVVVSLLNLNCFAQYALCGLNVGYKRSERPAIGVALTVSIAISAPAIAGLYSVMSPLGKDSDTDTNNVSDEESQKRIQSSEKRFLLSESNPKWSGGIFDFWEDISLAYLSLFCSFCVFGWNMERLGFGNMYVHMTTFLLFCLAPFWIFTLAAVNIENEIVREILGITGVFLCLFGLLYGGFWRIQMRKRFNLPSSDFCCGNPGVSDCVLWLCCCWCSLAQEVRTGNKYDVLDNKFYRKPEGEMSISPLPREEQLNYRSTPSPTTLLHEYKSSNIEEGSSSRGNDSTLEPPIPSFIHRDST
ncbi:unnamed protein product [Lactuca virosa]|uniref:PLAC8 motif-containing protein n=1 Tax=Lactuca virosa TaxID=75947 RepID=A0AAU9LS78_9ASTR|nr:unnamed protein product [Lactuca virosa]CAH1428996.1 unnamed protein product [Lactuca virosa]